MGDSLFSNEKGREERVEDICEVVLEREGVLML